MTREKNRTAANMGLAKVAVQWLIEHLCFVSSAVQADSFVLRNCHLRQAPNRYPQAENPPHILALSVFSDTQFQA